MNRLSHIFLSLATFLSAGTAAAHTAGAYAPYSPPSHHSYIIPASIKGVSAPAVSLDGEWDVKIGNKARWHKVSVPGELAMQGHGVDHDTPVVYRRQFTLPADFAGCDIILRFDGVYSYAKLYVNGTFVREHRGGFTRWEADVTGLLRPGKKNMVQLEVIDPVEELSYASGYAHHPVLGILRSVTLFALPKAHLRDTNLSASLDSTFTHGAIDVTTDFTGSGNARISLSVIAPGGKETASASFPLVKGANSFSLSVDNPLKWDAEHPNLYNVNISLIHGGDTLSIVNRRVGFRAIKVDGSRLLVNGKPVKLRGACRHDIHPRLGRATDAATDLADALLFKEANMNFVRTSHYPPSERFAEVCDSLSIYIECETAACFVETHRQKNYAPGASENLDEATPQYLGQIREMHSVFSSHPAVLFWSIGNESVYGSNFRQSADLIRKLDSSRPVIFSYPGSQPDSIPPVYDLLSMHYNDVYGNLWQWGKHTSAFQGEGIPAIFDEWAHPACYTYETLRIDPNIREFWGKSLDMMWDGVYRAPGALGGAIWGYVDERFFIPTLKTGTSYWKEFAHTAKPEGFRGDCVGYGDWGIVDIWRRKKPEFWATKKAYSPVRIESPRTLNPAPGTPLFMMVRNRFDHTSFSEIKAWYSYDGVTSQALLTDAQPHGKALLTLPAESWKPDTDLRVWFTDSRSDTIDSYLFSICPSAVALPEAVASGSPTPLKIHRAAEATRISGNGFEVRVNAATGLLSAEVDGSEVISSGPYLNAYINFNHLSGAEVRKTANHLIVDADEWQMESSSLEPYGKDVIVYTAGRYGSVRVTYTMRITPQSQLDIAYAVDSLPDGYLRETGLSFRLPDSYQTLAYEREGYWDSYPADAMSGTSATISLFNPHTTPYGERPSAPWASDTHDYYYWGDAGANSSRPLTVAAKAMKENIYFYALTGANGGGVAVVSPDAMDACRLSQPDGLTLTLYVDNRWDYPEIAWGNYCKLIEALPCHGTVRLRLLGR
ncbi:MAG: beta-galactosidase [Bacteroides sp.]|nr:beta-galactosidase [Bacteroides sp.]